MKNLRAMVASVDEYVSLAGRSCCAGRSWNGLDRSLSRHGVFDASDAEAPASVGDCSAVADESSDAAAGDGAFASSAPTS